MLCYESIITLFFPQAVNLSTCTCLQSTITSLLLSSAIHTFNTRPILTDHIDQLCMLLNIEDELIIT